jgi:putative transposase
MRLGLTHEARQAEYRQLFKHHLSELSLNEIRDATNKSWVLGSERFKQRIYKKLGRQVEPSARGGDRKSAQFHIEHDLVAFIKGQVEKM